MRQGQFRAPSTLYKLFAKVINPLTVILPSFHAVNRVRRTIIYGLERPWYHSGAHHLGKNNAPSRFIPRVHLLPLNGVPY